MGGDFVAIKGETAHISRACLEGAFRCLAGRANLAHRIGQDLVAPESLTAFLYYAGVATVEKSYRRCDQLLAREDEGGHYEAISISEGSACIAYHPHSLSNSDDAGKGSYEAFCGVRAGMLEALPLCFGLLPASVSETQCVSSGADECRFDVRFGSTSRTGLILGAAAGIACMSVLLLGVLIAAPTLVPTTGMLVGAALATFGVTLVTALAGRSFDLALQLETVAGARRGHLALLDQTDQRIAEKMDELCKVEATAAPPTSGQGRAMGLAGRAHPAREPDAREERLRSVRASEEIYTALGPLQRGLGEIRRELSSVLTPPVSPNGEAPDDWQEEVLAALNQCTEQSRHIQAVGAELGRSGPEAGKLRRPSSLADVVSRASESLGSDIPRGVELVLDLDDGLPCVRCEPFQMEQVVYQLLRNAAAATPSPGEFKVSLHEQPGGVELVVEDEGPGISQEELDAVFDPFSDGEAGSNGGLGLAICHRVISEHNGEMSISSQEGEGTRVRIVLPPDLLGKGSSSH